LRMAWCNSSASTLWPRPPLHWLIKIWKKSN
jgi:hypothetical protein